MISAGETSGELYGALLSREIKKRWPETEISGIGGPRMKAEGVNLIAGIAHVIGIVEAIRHIPEAKRTLNKAADFLNEHRPDILVLIDYPDFNLALAKKAKAAGVPVLYYVSPQVWAWRGGRVHKIAALAKKMAVLFPFEVEYYQKTPLPCEFVGHPITETINIGESKEGLKIKLGLDPEKDVVSILPGSRPNELNRHQFIVMELAAMIHKKLPDTQIVMPLVSGTEFPSSLPDYIKIVHGQTTEALACSSAAAVASGTATLETALVGTPMVVFYDVSPLTYYLAKMLATVRFISLVNILSDREVVKELLQKDAHAATIFAELNKILKDTVYRHNMIVNLKAIKDMLQGRQPSARVASIVGEIAGWSE